jgi:hypothetical protein
MAMTVIDMLWDDAAPAQEVVAAYKPIYTKESYLKMWKDLLG